MHLLTNDPKSTFFSPLNAGVFLTLLIRSMQKVKKLDKFEKMI